jgi:hypothetical protein
MNVFKGRPVITLLAASLLFGLLKSPLDAAIGLSYGESSPLARIAHDVAMMVWGAVVVWLMRWAQGQQQA